MISAAIVGCGRIAGGYDEAGNGVPPRTHAGAYRSHGVRIAACVEPDPERRAAFCKAWNVERAYADLAELSRSRTRFDLVSVCSPSEHHAADLELLLDMDVGGVICEKPLALDVAVARSAIERYRAARRPLAVAYLRRWDPNVADLSQSIQSGAFGQLQTAVAFYGKGLFNNGSHVVNLISFLAGPLEAISAIDRFPGLNAADPTLDCELRTRTGAPVRLVATDHRNFDMLELTLVFTKAVVEMQEGASRIVVRPIVPTPGFSGHVRPGSGESRPTCQDEAFTRLVGDMIGAVRAGGPIACDGADALDTLSVCAALVAFVSRS